MVFLAYTLTNEYMWKEIKGRVVVLHFDSGKYYSLNHTGSLIWKSILNNVPLDDIVEQLCSVYEVERDTARADVHEMIHLFQEKKNYQKKVIRSKICQLTPSCWFKDRIKYAAYYILGNGNSNSG